MLRTAPPQETRPSRPFPGDSQTRIEKLCLEEYGHGAALFKNGKYVEAEALFKAAYAQAEKVNDIRREGRCLTYVGACRCCLFRYREALEAWLAARQRSEGIADWVNLGGLGVDISSLYLLMGEFDSAAQAAERAVADSERGGFQDGLSRALIQLAVIRARQGRLDETSTEIRRAIEIADREGNLTTEAEAWDHFGAELLTRGDLAGADQAMTEAYRLRRLHRLAKLDSSYFNSARLRLAQHDPASALHLLDAALEPSHHSDSQVTRWELYQTRGRALLALNRGQEAFQDFDKALDFARRWRLEVLPADFARVGSEVRLNEIYSSFIEAGNRLYFTTQRPALARVTFQAAEENRAASLHALQALPDDWRGKLPARYWETLARLHAAEVELLSEDNETLRDERRSLRSAVLEMEAQAGANTQIPSAGLAERTQANMPRDAVLLSFHLGEPESFLWAISRERFCLYRLPGKAELAGDVGAFVRAVSTGETEAESRGHALYEKLFGKLDSRLGKKPMWILALDEQLFHVPFTALVTGWKGGQPVYLAQQHSVRVTTGVLRIGQDHGEPWREVASGRFLGVGDAIYNAADPRWHGRRVESPPALPWLALAATALSHGPVLTRLAGTAAELESCARAWNPQTGRSTLLRGAEASPGRLEAELQAQPTVIHIAAHFLEASAEPHYSMIALSLAASGDPQWLSPLDITRFKVTAGLVVLSGCSSGWADAFPGSGLMGLTRAWLAAGARAVIASHWPTPDDRGALFADFYRHFREKPEAGPAVALQEAQLDMLRAGGWRSHPQYWATYFVNGDL